MSISVQPYSNMREQVEDLLCRVSAIADSLHITGAALSRPEAHSTRTPVRTFEDPMMLDSCAQVALKAARELRAVHESVLAAIPEILPTQPAA